MNDFSEKLKLKGRAEEDIYFSRKDRELIEALRKKRLGKLADCSTSRGDRTASAHEKRFRKITRKHRKDPWRLAKGYRKLIRSIKKRCRIRRGK